MPADIGFLTGVFMSMDMVLNCRKVLGGEAPVIRLESINIAYRCEAMDCITEELYTDD